MYTGSSYGCLAFMGLVGGLGLEPSHESAKLAFQCRYPLPEVRNVAFQAAQAGVDAVLAV